MKKTSFAVFIIVILSLIGFFSYQIVLNKPTSTKKLAQKTQKTSPLLAYRAPMYPKTANKKRSAAAPGKQTYTITQTHHSPNFTQAVIDPEEVKVGQKQTMTVTLGDEKAPITEVVAEIETDTGIIKNSLKRISGTDRQGIWEGSWIVQDTHDTTYITTFKAVNSLGEKGEARISWTDPGCSADGGVGHGTALTITANCTVSGVDGADGGLFTITSGTVTIAASAVLSANDFTISGGTLSENSSGSISIVASSVICMTDGDADGYPATTAQYADGSACAGGRRRRYLLATINTLDCNDAAYSTTNTCGAPSCTTSADCNPPTTGCDLNTMTCTTDHCDACDNGPEGCTGAGGYNNCDYAPAICSNCCGFRNLYQMHRCWPAADCIRLGTC